MVSKYVTQELGFIETCLQICLSGNSQVIFCNCTCTQFVSFKTHDMSQSFRLITESQSIPGSLLHLTFGGWNGNHDASLHLLQSVRKRWDKQEWGFPLEVPWNDIWGVSVPEVSQCCEQSTSSSTMEGALSMASGPQDWPTLELKATGKWSCQELPTGMGKTTQILCPDRQPCHCVSWKKWVTVCEKNREIQRKRYSAVHTTCS